MDAKLVVNGKEFDIVINDPELIQMVTKTEEKNGYERVSISDIYYYTDIDGTVGDHMEHLDELDGDQYSAGNYYNNRKLAEDAARAETLMRRLKRFVAERNDTIDWNNADQRKYDIYYSYTDKDIRICSYNTVLSFGGIAFSSEELAEEAISLYKDDLIWYFTKYKGRL